MSDYERVIARHEAKPKPAFWYGLGAATPVVAGIIAALVYLAVK